MRTTLATLTAITFLALAGRLRPAKHRLLTMTDTTPTKRQATPSDQPCSCGLPAIVIYLTERYGEVPSCR